MTSPAQPAALVLILALAASCAAPRAASPPPAAAVSRTPHGQHAREVESWRKQRLSRLTAETGFLALSGLFWLKEGVLRLGSGPEAQVRFPARAPADLGQITVAQGVVTLTLAPGVEASAGDQPVRGHLKMRHDSHPAGPPHRVALDGFTFMLIKRGSRLAIRLWDRKSPTRTGFAGLRHFGLDRRWRVTGQYTPYATPQPIKIPTVVKTTTDAFLTGEVRLLLGGKACTLYPLAWPGDKELFFHFTDGTTGRQTYGGGRFLVSKHGVDQPGEVVLDFNKAYTPPCAFTEYATCPVPLEQNRLSVLVTAGEKNP